MSAPPPRPSHIVAERMMPPSHAYASTSPARPERSSAAAASAFSAAPAAAARSDSVRLE
jgi:hypothetical protein